MSIFFDPHKQKPRIWTFFIFFLLTALVVGGCLTYANIKAGQRAKENANVPEEPHY